MLYDITGATPVKLLADAVIRSWSRDVYGPRRLTFRLPAGSANAGTSTLQKYRRVKLFRQKQDGSYDETCEWWGYLESHKHISPAEYEVYCAGPVYLFKHRFSHKDETFTGQGSTEAFDLLAQTNSEDGDTGVTAGTGGVTTTRDVKAQGYQDVLSIWEELKKAHDCDLEIDSDWVLNFVPSVGTDKSVSLPPLVYRSDEPGSTVEGVEEGEDGAPLRNKIIGTNSAGTLTSVMEDAASQATYGVLVEVKVFNEAQDQTTLDAMTQAYLDQVKQPAADFGARPKLSRREFDVVSGGLAVTGEEYGDTVPGDLRACEIVTAGETLDAVKRVIEILVEVEKDKERVTFTLAEEGVFVSANGLAGRTGPDIERRVLKLEQGAAGSGGGGGGGGSSDFVDKETPSGSINGVNTSFTLSQTPIAGSEHVYRNGQLQADGGVDYSISGTIITFVSPPLTGDALVVSYRITSPTSFADKEVPSGAIDGSNATFTLAHTPTAGSEHVFLNGILQADGGGDYAISTGTITFNTPPPSGSVLLVSYRY